MKKNLTRVTLFILIIIAGISCKKSSSSSSETSTSTSTTSNTWVKLTTLDGSGNTKSNYTIMMFDQPVSATAALPPILKQVSTDASGLGYFDLTAMITSSTKKTYYFEAFLSTPTGYTLESTTHYDVELAKGTMATSVILVK